ncbi:MAG TPA: class I SAM-dependent methyltransferase [Gaiellaceae bacterium]|nr:class I SAM-dependent methyltransferase [Gaiellaceae bacterium]
MPTVQELYELWAGDSALEVDLGRSLDPRGREWLFELFASLGPQPGEIVLDVGARDAEHLVRLVREHGLRGIALDPVALHVERAREAATGLDIEVREAAIESMPLENASVDWIWCRDVLVHVDLEQGLAECARVLKPGGRMLAYANVATELLDPAEAALLAEGVAAHNLDAAEIEAAAASAGFSTEQTIRVDSEWRERMLEDGEWDANDQLLRLSRLRRRESELVERFGALPVNAYAAGRLWPIYHAIGKLAGVVYVWQGHA